MNDKLKKSEEEKFQISSKLKLIEEKYIKAKSELEATWTKLMDKEKKFNELQLEVKLFILTEIKYV